MENIDLEYICGNKVYKVYHFECPDCHMITEIVDTDGTLNQKLRKPVYNIVIQCAHCAKLYGADTKVPMKMTRDEYFNVNFTSTLD